MNNITEAFDAEIAQLQNEFKRVLNDPSSLIELCRQKVDEVAEMNVSLFQRKIVRDYLKGRHIKDLISLAEEDGHLYQALWDVAKEFLIKNKPLPCEVSIYLLKVELNVHSRPKASRSKTHILRNAVICQCIELIHSISPMNMYRNEATNHKPVCVISIVADAANLTYDSTRKIWEKRPIEISED